MSNIPAPSFPIGSAGVSQIRVLAAQDSFFAEADPRQRREWLSRVHPQALVLSDSDLDQVLAQAA